MEYGPSDHEKHCGGAFVDARVSGSLRDKHNQLDKFKISQFRMSLKIAVKNSKKKYLCMATQSCPFQFAVVTGSEWT